MRLGAVREDWRGCHVGLDVEDVKRKMWFAANLSGYVWAESLRLLYVERRAPLEPIHSTPFDISRFGMHGTVWKWKWW